MQFELMIRCSLYDVLTHLFNFVCLQEYSCSQSTEFRIRRVDLIQFRYSDQSGAFGDEQPTAQHNACASPETDIGYYDKSGRTDDFMKFRLLTEPLSPSNTYNFKADSLGNRRTFRFSWLAQYSPWLAYSPLLKGPFCLTCVLFPQSIHHGYSTYILSWFKT